MGLKLLIPPALEPVTLDETVLHCRDIDPADFPTLLRQITAARTWVENRTGRALVNQTWLWSIDRFQDVVLCAGPNSQPVELEPGKDPLATGWPTTGTRFLVPATVGAVTASPTRPAKHDAGAGPERLQDRRHHATGRSPAFGLYWPFSLAEIGAVNVTYQAGYGSPATVAAPGSPVAWKPSTAYTMG